MTIVQIAVLAIVAVVIGRLSKGRELALLAVSTFVVFWLQPVQPLVTLSFWMPVATLTITILAWVLTSPAEARSWKLNWPAVAVLVGVALLMDANHYFKLDQIFVTDTPRLHLVLGALAAIAATLFVLARFLKNNRFWLIVLFAIIVLIFVFLKSPSLMETILGRFSNVLETDPSQPLTSLSWLGFSYLAFRILHTIRDIQSGRLPSVTLGEYVNYVIFFPAFTAGPIDRIERFVKELRSPLPLDNADWLDAGTRLFVGLFKKFVLAELLSVISLSDILVSQVKTSGWMWVFLYAYAFQIYFDFSGYTDVAIGLGRLIGIRLPENFAAPYLKPNLTQFWNSWHITLTQWFRSYFFNPVTRSIRSSKRPWPVWTIILVTQISTMVLIGLWHGMAWSFVSWGLWHGVGLFIQNRWSDFVRNRMPAWTQTRNGQIALNVTGVFLTFNFVALGWLFFNLSTPEIALQAMRKLFGLA